MKPATEILLSAAFVLTPEEHWMQHGFEAHSTYGPSRYCVLGAIEYAAKQNTLAYVEAKRALGKAIGRHRAISTWNDARRRTHAEVLDALYRAAEIAEAS